jgi:D-alanyl-D-alanine carboxypeptidase (penicillin-binding protein 5/6)
LEVNAKSAIIMDEASGIVIWAKDPDTPRPPASTTKILTALLLIEHGLPADPVIAPPDVDKVKESSMNLKPGEKLSLNALAHGILLRSANDASYAAAVHVAGSEAAFCEMMNDRARAIGATSASFKNPHGLTAPGHRISARDLGKIGREAMKNAYFRQIVRTRVKEISRSINQKDLVMVNRNRYLRQDPTADGIKTGFTTPAGQCYVGSATRNGYRLITVILNSKGYRSDQKAMLDWAFANFEPYTFYREDEVVAELEYQGRRVEARAASDVRAMRASNGMVPVVDRIDRLPTPEDRDGTTVIAYATARYPTGESFRFPLKEGRTISLPLSTAAKTAGGGTGWWVLLVGGALLLHSKARRWSLGSTARRTQA